MIGKTISHYKIIEKLGEGGMGVVYKAEDTKLERTVALKFLSLTSIGDEERKRFKIEAQAAAALNHPNITTIHAIEEVDDDTFIVMEYIKGKELKELTTDDGELSIEDVTNYATQIAEGLKAAHEEDVTHRDIKSANIMITEKGQIKIMDFGLAKVRGGAQVTKMGTTLGTAAYMSPEQAQSLKADHRTDIWSYGVVLYEMLTGKMPFPGDYEQAVIYSILNEEPEPISNLRPETPELLQEVVSRALARDPSERFQTVKEVVNLLGRVSGQTDDARQLLDRPKQKSSKLSRRVIALLGVIFFVVAGSIYFFKASGEALDTLAILPLTNQSDDKEMEYLSDGISETLIFKLSQLPNLKVRSLSSVLRYKGTSPDLRKVGADLNVRAVLTGRVAVRNDRLAIVVELVDTRDNSTIWGNTYNRMLADLLTVQDEISSNILTRLQLELTGEALEKVDKHYTDNAEAYQAFLKGRYFTQNRTEDNLKKAIKYYQQAIDIEPNYAVAYAGLSEVYFLHWAYGFLSADEALPKAEQAAEKALEIDSALSEAHVSLGLVYVDYHWDFSTAEHELKRAIELNPNNANARHHYSYLLSHLGRLEESIREAKTGLELEPLSALMTRGVALAYFYARQYDRALKYYQDCLEINPNSLSATFHLVYVYHQMRLEDKSIAMLEKYHRLIGEDTMATQIKRTYERSGYRSTVRDLLRARTVGFLADEGAKAYLFAMIGENERSLESLQRAVEQRSSYLPWANVHPSLDPVRSDPRFSALMDKVFGRK